MIRQIATLGIVTLATAAAVAQTAPKGDIDQLRALAGSGRCDRALVGVEALRARYPDDPDVYVIEANCLLSENAREETRFVPAAYQALRLRAEGRYVDSDARHALYETKVVYEPGIVQEAERLLGEAIRRAPFRRDLYIGRCYLNQLTDRHDALLESAALAAVRVPDAETNRALLTYVDAYLARGEAEHAVSLAEVIAEHFGEDATTWATVGRARLMAGDLDGARTAYAQAANQDAENVRILEAGAEVEMLSRSWAEATALYTRVLERRPRDNTARFHIALCKARSAPLEALNHLQGLLVDNQGRGGPMHKAAVTLREMLSAFPVPGPDAWHELGRSMAEDNLSAAAVAAWDVALELDPSHRASLVAIGELYGRLRLADLARESFEMARSLESPEGEDDEALDARIGWAYLLSGRPDEALAVYLASEDPAAHGLEIAAIHMGRDDTEAARTWLLRAAGRPELKEEAERRLAGLPGKEERPDESGGDS